MKYETIIGLEIHVQLKTKSKMFCACPNDDTQADPNELICPICLGHPGILPVVNEQAIKFGIKAALALNLKVREWSKFDRKSYFYPDLPKGYQISQYDKPLAEDGYLEILLPSGSKKFGIERLHLEEDAAKNIHQDEETLVDFNRSGTPLAEIVTQPDFRTPAQAKAFLQELRLIMRYLGVSDADMEKGQLRCDANISLRRKGESKLYPKTEVKNINSFKAVERALQYEIDRQTELWDKDEIPEFQETRGWDENKGVTVEQRTKENASDYRYFPEPDLPPLELTTDKIQTIKSEIKELPNAKRKRLMEQYNFKYTEADVLVNNPELASYTEKVISELLAWLSTSPDTEGTADEIADKYNIKVAKLVGSWLINNLLKLLNDAKQTASDLKITAEDFAEFLSLILEGKVNSSAAQAILIEMFTTGADPHVIMEEKDLGQVSDSNEIQSWIDQVVLDNPKQVEEYQSGKEPILKYLIGMVMKKSKGKADPGEVEKLLKEKLN